MDTQNGANESAIDRGTFLKKSAAAAIGAAAVTSFPSIVLAAKSSKSYPALGTYPAGISGDTAMIGIISDLTGSYSADGEDLVKGYKLAIKHLNAGGGLVSKVPTLSGKGVLGKRLVYKIGDSETKANPAVQAATEFIERDKAIMICGDTSSAVVIALEKLAQREKVLFLAGASGSNDTTGKDCQRYGFRSQPSAYMDAKALAPILKKELGSKRRAVYLVPDYTYGTTLYESMKEFTEKIGWTTVNHFLAPVGTTDYSSYLLNIANSGADVFVNIEFGNDAVASTKQAAQFGIFKTMQMIVPNISSYMPDGVGAEIMAGVYGTQDWYWGLAGNKAYPEAAAHSKIFLDDFLKEFNGVYPRWTAHIAYDQTLTWADAVERAGTFYPPEVIKALESGHKINLCLGPVAYRAEDHQQIRPVPVLKGKKPSAMKNKDDYFEIVGMTAGPEAVPPLGMFGCRLPGYT